MRQIYKDIVIGFILASFTFAPNAFAKPRSAKVRKVTKAPTYAGMLKTIKKSKKGLKVSSLIESAEPMIKKREYRDIRKMTLPYWDKKFDQFTVGKDYFKIKFKGKTLFARYVDRGPVAFMVNNQPFLWKDFLIYGRAKARMTEIVMGKKAKKVSAIESVLGSIFPKAYAKTGGDKPEICEQNEGEVVRNPNGAYEGCRCPDGTVIAPDIGTPNCRGAVAECPAGQEKNAEGQCVVIAPDVDPTEPSQGDNKMMWPILIGAGLLLLILLLKKKKKKKKPTDPEPEPPTPGWTPEPEGQCPTPGARGLTEADLPPECRTSSCGTTSTCSGTDCGVIY